MTDFSSCGKWATFSIANDIAKYFAIIIPMLIPLALKGVKYRPMPAEKLLMYNLLVYGLGE